MTATVRLDPYDREATMWKRFLFLLLMLALPADSMMMLAAETTRSRPRKIERVRAKRTLDDVVMDVRTRTESDGSRTVSTALTEAVPYSEFVDMMRAVNDDEAAAPAPAPLSTPPDSPYVCQLVPGDQDNDGDGFVGAEEITGSTLGPYISDVPRVTADFQYITLRVEYDNSGDVTDTFEETTENRTDFLATKKFKDLVETKRSFQSDTNINLHFGNALGTLVKPFGFKTTLKAELHRTHTVTRESAWTFEQQDKWNKVWTKKVKNQITWTANSGKLTAQATIRHAGRKTAISITALDILVTTIDPLTGDKEVIHTISRTWPSSNPLTLAANGERTLGIIEENLNTATVVNKLKLGAHVEFEATGIQATEDGTGDQLEILETAVVAKTAMIGIHYGDTRDDPNKPNSEFFRVAIDDGDGVCATVREMLETIRLPQDLEFERREDGELVIKRVFEVANVNDDMDVEEILEYNELYDPDLTYGRWIVGYEFDEVSSRFYGDLDLELTPLHAGDRVHLYYLTLSDFIDDSLQPGFVGSADVGNTGAWDNEHEFERNVQNYDYVELSSTNSFLRSVQGTQNAGTVYVSGCGQLYGATRYFINTQYDSSNQHSIGTLDFYGLEVQNNYGQWLPISEVLHEPGGIVIQDNGYPTYDFTIGFLISPSFSNRTDQASVPFKVRNTTPRTSSFWIGFRGYNVRGQLVDCRSSVASPDFTHNEVTLKIYGYDFDDDDDGGVDKVARAGGIDHRDVDPISFERAPEVLDGIDNDGDNQVDDGPLLCKPLRRPNEDGVCELDNRLGYYPASPNVTIRSRIVMEDGTVGSWTDHGLTTSVNRTMPADLAVDYLEFETTYDEFGYPSRSGTNIVRQIDPPAPDLFSAGQLIEAERGELLYPMAIDTDASVKFIHVVAGGLEGSASYRIDVATAGDYRVWAMVAADDAENDRMTVEIADPQGGLVDRIDFDFSEAYGQEFLPGVWVIKAATDSQAAGNPTTLTLSPGEHTITVLADRMGPRMDWLVLTPYCVDIDGDGWTTCNGDCDDGNPNVNPGLPENCGTGFDDDCDGYINEGCGGGCGRKCPDIYQQP